MSEQSASWQSLDDALVALLAQERKPVVPVVLPLVQQYYALPGNGVGGSLHIVLDDCNVEDSSVQFCLRWAIDHGDVPGQHLAEVLLRMSKTQRRKLSNSDLGLIDWQRRVANNSFTRAGAKPTYVKFDFHQTPDPGDETP